MPAQLVDRSGWPYLFIGTIADTVGETFSIDMLVCEVDF